jgi:hypothetical protein
MKTKFLLPLLAAFMLTLPAAEAQYNYNQNAPRDDYWKHEMYAEYGVITRKDLIIVSLLLFVDISAAIFNRIVEDLNIPAGINYTRTHGGTKGTIALGYNYYFTPRWSLGAMVNYQGFRTYLDFDNGVKALWKNDIYALHLRTDIRWVNQPMVQMYSGIGIGGAWWKSGYDEPNINFVNTGLFSMQITPIGMRVGKQIGGFIEMGWGSNGLLVGGISGKF